MDPVHRSGGAERRRSVVGISVGCGRVRGGAHLGQAGAQHAQRLPGGAHKQGGKHLLALRDASNITTINIIMLLSPQQNKCRMGVGREGSIMIIFAGHQSGRVNRC